MCDSPCSSGAEQTFIFTGPSLHPDEARTLINATILPPIRRGDLKMIRASRPDAIGIIDGDFYQSLAISPKEILPLLEEGVAIYGASSMGALRAVELEKFGMVGVGRVFRLFRAGFLDADDEVALAYEPASYRPLSDPLVNTRFACRAAVRRGVLHRNEASGIVEALKRVYFPERTRNMLVSIAAWRIGSKRSQALRDYLEQHAPNVKRDDAKMMIAAMKRRLIAASYNSSHRTGSLITGG